MAKPAPCQVCGQVPDAHFIITNRGIISWQFEQMTVAICIGCAIAVADEWKQALELVRAQQPEEPTEGVLEQIEADEGPQPLTPAEGPPKGRKSKTPETSSNGQEVTEAAPAAHE
jgi:hypothetical protein